MSASGKIRVLIVDDSALVRKILSVGLGKDRQIEVVGQAGDPYRARDLIVELHPDVITLDVEMPRMDGVTFLKRFMPIMPIPTVVISSLTQAGKRVTLDALEAGAVDVIAKPTIGLTDGLPVMLDDICARVKAAATVNVAHFARKEVNFAVETGTGLPRRNHRPCDRHRRLDRRRAGPGRTFCLPFPPTHPASWSSSICPLVSPRPSPSGWTPRAACG